VGRGNGAGPHRQDLGRCRREGLGRGNGGGATVRAPFAAAATAAAGARQHGRFVRSSPRVSSLTAFRALRLWGSLPPAAAAFVLAAPVPFPTVAGGPGRSGPRVGPNAFDSHFIRPLRREIMFARLRLSRRDADCALSRFWRPVKLGHLLLWVLSVRGCYTYVCAPSSWDAS
jgi:hypothetical protein